MTSLPDQNARQIEREIAGGQDRVLSYPNDIFFSSEHRCNLRCLMCASTADRKRGVVPLTDRKLPELTLARFNKLEPQMPYWREVRLTGSGETLISPELPRILELLAPHPAVSSFATNGLLLDRQKSELLVHQGLNRLIISMDASRGETYERIRVGGQWDTLLEGVQTMVQVKRESGSELPEIFYYGTFRRDNIEELPELVDFAAAHDGAGVWAHKTIIYDSDLKDLDLSRFPELTRQMVTEAAVRARGHGIEFGNWILEYGAWEEVLESAGIDTGRAMGRRFIGSLKQRLRGLRQSPTHPLLNACQRPWTGLLVQSDGKVRVCCNNSILLGNLNEQSFAEIWNGAPARTLRRSFLDGQPPEGCRSCAEVTNRLDLSSCYVGRAGDALQGFLDCPVEGESLQGLSRVKGWLLDRQGIDSARILVDGEPAGLVECGIERPDVAAIHGGEPHARFSGFSHHLDTRVLDDGYHLLALRFLSRDNHDRELFHRTVLVNNRR